MSAPRAVDVVSFGCRLNAYESEVMRDHATAAGLTETVIVNTCAVTKEAERQGVQAIRKIKRANPGARVIVAGCAVQLDPAKYAAMPEVARVLGNEHKMKPASFLPDIDDPVLVSDIMQVRETAEHLIEGFHGRVRAFVQVQQGCDHRCTFCIIPFARGNNRSVPMGRIVTEVRALVAGGVSEVVVTGVDITGYGADLPGQPTLGQMARRLLAAVPELRRLRFSSLDPAEVDEDIFALIEAEPRVMPHLHISAQSGDDIILKRMKRRHTRVDIARFCDRVRTIRPGAVFGADLIAGFPTETDAMFENTARLIDDCGLTHLHVFPYSIRPGTPAARMPPVDGAVVKARAARLRALGAAAMDRYLTGRIGDECSVLVEQPGRGHDDHFVPVDVVGDHTPGAVITGRITAAGGGRLTAATLTA